MKQSPEKSRNSAEEAKAASQPAERGISRWKLALGAASLFFFVVGVKRSFRTDDGREILQRDADLLDEEREEVKLAIRKDPGTATPGAGNRPRAATKTESGSRSTKKTEAASRLARKAGPSARSARKAEAGSRNSTTDRGSDDDPRRSRTRRPGRGDPDHDERRRR